MSRWATRIVLFLVVLVLLGSMPGASSHASSSGPYQSALSNSGDGTVWAAKPAKCNSYCEFIAPGFHCIAEGSHEKCVTGSGGCQTVACP